MLKEIIDVVRCSDLFIIFFFFENRATARNYNPLNFSVIVERNLSKTLRIYGVLGKPDSVFKSSSNIKMDTLILAQVRMIYYLSQIWLIINLIQHAKY